MSKSKEIFELHLKAALILVRDIRIASIRQQIDAKAMRIAIYYLKFVDDHFAKKRLTRIEDGQLKQKAWDLFRQVKEKGEL